MIMTSNEITFLCVFLLAVDLSATQSESGQRFVSLLRDGDSSRLRQVPPSAERGPPPGAHFVSIPVVPLPFGAMRRPHDHIRPSRPPPPPPPSSTLPPPPPETLIITEEPTPPPPPQTRPKRPLLVPFWATSLRKPQVNIPLIYSEDYRNDDGSYSFAYEAANSIAQQETGYTRHENGQDILVKKGYYRFVSPEGLPFRVDYQADENGFRAIGQHLPK